MNFDIEQLRIFEKIMETHSFNAAAEQLGMAQSSVSQRINRLEGQVGRKLFKRTTRRVEPTPAGDAFLTYARTMLAVAEKTRRFFEASELDDVIKLGIVEDFALGELHMLLALFRNQHPNIALSIRTGMSGTLMDKIDNQELDVVLGKRLPGRPIGHLLRTDRLVWCGDLETFGVEIPDPIPVVTHLQPSETRTIIADAMREADRAYVVVAESDGLSGIQAAVDSGIGIAAFSEGFIPKGMTSLPAELGLPTLGHVEYVIDFRRHGDNEAVEAFVDLLTQSAKIASGNAAG